MKTREYGTAGPTVVLLHGGPGAPGYLAPLAEGLQDSFRVLEPFQRGSGPEPLTVARHLDDLRQLLIGSSGPDAVKARPRPALVGHSWGAMLGLAFAARYPGTVAGLCLIGCGTFDPISRQRLRDTRESRTSAELRGQLEAISSELQDPDERLRAVARLSLAVDSYDVGNAELELTHCDARAHDESWNDMLRLQAEGFYPMAFSAIREPVLLLHGTADPHPGPLVADSLRPYLPQLEYRELDRCGHYPWLEPAAVDEFFLLVRGWLGQLF